MRTARQLNNIHTETYTRTYIQRERDLSTSESTKAEPQEMLETPATTLIKLSSLNCNPEGRAKLVMNDNRSKEIHLWGVITTLWR